MHLIQEFALQLSAVFIYLITECIIGFYGHECNMTCEHCNKTSPGCLQINGSCLHGCESNQWEGEKCDGWYLYLL